MKKAYHTPTKQSVIDRAKKWKEEGVDVHNKFLTGEFWDYSEEETCVIIDNNGMEYGYKNFYKKEGYKIIPYEKKLEYGYCEEGDVIVHEAWGEIEIIKVTEKGLWRVAWNCKEEAYFDTWEEVAGGEKNGTWKIKQPTEDTITVKMKRSDYDTLKDIELEIINNSK
jgi:hypothetical protein